MFDSREYEWADLSLILGGSDIARFRGVKYTQKIEREALFCKGRTAVAIQSGNITVEGEITMMLSAVLALEKASKSGILSLSLDALINYGNPSAGDAMTTDRIIGIRFTEIPKELKQGDKFMEVTLPFLALRVENNV